MKESKKKVTVTFFFYFAFVLMLLRYCFAYRNRKRRDIIIIIKTVKFNFLILTDTVVSRQTADVTLGGILQLYLFYFFSLKKWQSRKNTV
jgi:hypothetical protein